MDTDEAAQRAVGLLTAVYTAMHEGGTVADLSVMVKSVLADMKHDPLEIEVSGAVDAYTIARTAAEKAREQLMSPMIEILATFVSGFAVICRTYETDGPDADIYGKLREFGLSI